MDSYFTSERKDLKSCRTEQISECGLTLKQVKGLIGNPAGVSRADVLNPNYKGKVSVQGDKLTIALTYVLTGHINRAEACLLNLKKVFSNAGIVISFTPSSHKFDLRIHGANLAEFVQGLKLCDCEAARYIGGWGPSYLHHKWGNALLVNPHPPKSTWTLSDAHEFCHKLGLKHKTDGGVMDYPPKKGKDKREFLESDKKRIIALYK